MSPRRVLLTALGWCWLAAIAGAGENLVVDASFESPLPPGSPNIPEPATMRAGGSWRRLPTGLCWPSKPGTSREAGSSEPVRLAGRGNRAGGGAHRGRAVSGPGRTALRSNWPCSTKGQKKLASFGQLPLDGKTAWQTVAKSGVARGSLDCEMPPGGREERNSRDAWKWIASAVPRSIARAVADNSDLAVEEAKTWRRQEAGRSWILRQLVSGTKAAYGWPGRMPSSRTTPLSRRLAVRQTNLLWVRRQPLRRQVHRCFALGWSRGGQRVRRE